MATFLSLGNRMSLPAVALLYLSYAGTRTPLSAATDDINLHVVAAANDGSPLRPHITTRKNGDVAASVEPITQLNGKEIDRSPEECMDDYLDEMVANIDRTPIVGGQRKILIFTHGGMNCRNGAIVRAFRIMAKLKDKYYPDNYYPIFIAWNSEPFSCYGEHLFRIRQGQFRHLSYALPTVPFYFLADVARGTRTHSHSQPVCSRTQFMPNGWFMDKRRTHTYVRRANLLRMLPRKIFEIAIIDAARQSCRV
jgi:hypothetical protein